MLQLTRGWNSLLAYLLLIRQVTCFQHHRASTAPGSAHLFIPGLYPHGASSIQSCFVPIKTQPFRGSFSTGFWSCPSIQQFFFLIFFFFIVPQEKRSPTRLTHADRNWFPARSGVDHSKDGVKTRWPFRASPASCSECSEPDICLPYTYSLSGW